MEYKELFQRAQSVLEFAYAPYSKFQVGAALLMKNGDVFTGVNVENASYGATICAERTAFVKAISEGRRDFSALAVASSGGTAYPCGICRQFIYQFSDDLAVITGDDEDHLSVCTIKDLLPKGFRL